MMDKEFLKLLILSTDNISSSVTSNFKPEYLDLDVSGFSPLRELYVVVVAFFSKFRSVVPSNQLESFLVSRAYPPDRVKQILSAYDELSLITTDKNFEFLVQELKRAAAMKTLHSQLDRGADAIIKNDLTAALDTIKTGINKSELILQTQVEEGSIAESIQSRVELYKDLKHHRKSSGLTSGFKTFDALTGGLKSGELDVIMSGSSEGKSTCMLNIGYHVQTVLNKNVLMFSLELPKIQIERRYDALASGLNINKLKHGTLSEEEESIYKATLFRIKKNVGRFYVVDLPLCSATVIAAKLTELSTMFPIDLVIVDYLGLMKPSISTGSGWQDISNTALELRDIARTYKVPVLTAMQVKKDSQKQKSAKAPKYDMTDIALSFQVIYHSDTVLTLKVANPEVLGMGVSICELNASVTKCRDGQQGEFVIDAVFDRMKMQEREYGSSTNS